MLRPCSPLAQIKAAAAHVERVKRNKGKGKNPKSLGIRCNILALFRTIGSEKCGIHWNAVLTSVIGFAVISPGHFIT
jgi:hypothetical protein